MRWIYAFLPGFGLLMQIAAPTSVQAQSAAIEFKPLLNPPQFSPPPRGGSTLATAGGGSRLVEPDTIARGNNPLPGGASGGVASGDGGELVRGPEGRGKCADGPLAALVPPGGTSLTVKSSPTLFVSLPITTVSSAKLELQDSQGKVLYQAPVNDLGKQGVMRLKLPARLVLEVGKTYWWTFTLDCPSEDLKKKWRVGGAIQRINSASLLSGQFDRQLKRTSPQREPALYAQAGLWQDTLASLYFLRQIDPSDQGLEKAWSRLLVSQGLGKVADKPLVQR